ncbi:MAG TPA: TonB-dependent receptor [Usitatibacter sp.]|nr:TonB-dependent receptor [Usitatibacter sp.]
MKNLSVAGVVGLASLGALAQSNPPYVARTLEPVVHTATRGFGSPVSTVRDTVVITREELEGLGGLNLAEVLQARAGAEIRAGGPGQAAEVFLRGAGAANALVLVDGLRVESALSGIAPLQALSLEMIERIEVVKGGMASLYGSGASGGVIHVFTRGKTVPHLFTTAAYGTDNDRGASAGLATADLKTTASLSLGARKVDAPSATNARAGANFDADEDAHENAFATLRISQLMWQGERITLEGFGSRSRTALDRGAAGDRADHKLVGGRIHSATTMMRGWASSLSIGHTRDDLRFRGLAVSRFETRQDQLSWVNDITTTTGHLVAGAELMRQSAHVDGDDAGGATFAVSRRETTSVFASINESVGIQRIEASIRREDDDDAHGARNASSVSWGIPFTARGPQLVATMSRGFRTPTLRELYLVTPELSGNPGLAPERSRGYELAVRGGPSGPLQSWKVTGFDTRFDDLIVISPGAGTLLNVSRARTRGVEAALHVSYAGVQLRASYTVQKPRDESTGLRLRNHARRFGALEASRKWGAWTAGLSVVTSGDRYDAPGEEASARLAGYTRLDARVRYDISKLWKAELAAVNLTDRRYETALGYDAPRRGVMLSVRLDAF